MWFKLNSKTRVLFSIASVFFITLIITKQIKPSEVTRHYSSASVISKSKSAGDTGGVLIGTKHGLGNQLFYYAAGYALARNLNIPLLLPQPWSLRDSSIIESNNTRKREYLLDQLILPSANVVSYDEIKKHNKLRHASCAEAATISKIPKEVQETTKYFLMDAYCFDETYFKAYSKEIKQIKVKVNNPTESYKKWKELIQQSIFPVAVHVRRGDLVKQNYMTTPIEYFKSAMQKMKEVAPSGVNKTFFVFSDEMDFARGGLTNGSFIESLGVPVYFVSGSYGGLTNLEEFHLMIQCKSIVISNSTFSWWAAYLMKDSVEKVVIRPTIKTTAKSKGKRKVYVSRFPKAWVSIETTFH